MANLSTPRTARNMSQNILPVETPIEEETLPHYEPAQYFPVNIGDVFKARYQVTAKLGYGAYSTSWLCHDLRQGKFAVVKVSTSLPKFPTATERELKVYEHLANVKSAHPGQSLIRNLYDTFELQGIVGKHQCLVLQPMHMTVLEMMGLNSKPFNLDLLKMTLKRILLALDFLHSEAEVDDKMLDDLAKAESEEPSPRKPIDASRTIYRSRRFRRPKGGRGDGLPVLCDFGEARIGKKHESGPFVQPHIYRAPEIIFEMTWRSAVDIWNLACLAWDLFEGQHLFGDIFDESNSHDPFKHLALMVALIGPPPEEFVKRSETTQQCFDSRGRFLFNLNYIADEITPIPSTSLEALEQRLPGHEKKLFLQFLRSMLKWLPEERRTAKQLLDDPWLGSC
ncbi:kinase domain protein [Lineolata rhizophorae]|uniref:non-specific serine/threonine protein kinase n=1 Tax=Lineolata rhizophorae TaxID=578093 RepID=A0A6A6P6Q1_9PEZI|nr:kinase domain protein [Lineolata rhizophorae]